MPNMSNKLMIHILSGLGRNQFVAAPDAINSEEGALIGRHRIPQPVIIGQSVKP
jgi:hypothetical protein